MEQKKKEESFRVVDKRFSSDKGDTEKTEKEAKSGEGFVMKETPAHAPASPDEIDFSTFVMSLATGAIISLGLAPDPITKKKQKNIDLARQNIEILALLKNKTKGNLSDEENQLIESLLAEVQLRFVNETK